MRKFIHAMAIPVLLSGCTHSGDATDPPFLETTWNLTELYSENIRYSGSQVPHLRFEADRVTGHDGCNNFFGPYKLSDDKLSFGLLASTRMACPQINGFDLVFHKTLLTTRRFRIDGSRLDLFAGDELLASFAAAQN